MPSEPSIPHHSWLYRRVVLPILALLRCGATPEKLAWSLAIGFLIGINPLLGSTTILCLLLAFVLRLNIAASQIANHLMYPVQIVLVIPFIGLGSRVFRTERMPLSAKELLHAARQHPLDLIRQLWLWESHALVLWLAFAALTAPIIAIALTPLLHRLLTRVQAHQYPIIPEL